MSKKFKIRKRSKGPAAPVEINITPMIDMFSVLNSFLLMAAVFSASGLIRVEIPFLSSKPPEPVDKKQEPEKVVSVVVDNTFVLVDISTTESALNPEKEKYDLTPQGLDQLQGKLYSLRQSDRKFDKVTVMTELDVPYEKLIQVLDAMRELKPGRPPIPLPIDYKVPSGVDRNALIPKIVLGNVIL